jgi:hypothetical protein
LEHYNASKTVITTKQRLSIQPVEVTEANASVVMSGAGLGLHKSMSYNTLNKAAGFVDIKGVILNVD